VAEAALLLLAFPNKEFLGRDLLKRPVTFSVEVDTEAAVEVTPDSKSPSSLRGKSLWLARRGSLSSTSIGETEDEPTDSVEAAAAGEGGGTGEEIISSAVG